MTREEAIRIMALEREDWETSHCTPYERKCAFDMAIEALKAQESKQLATNLQPCKQDADDTISRKAAIEAIDVKNVNKGIISALQSIIEELPSAQPDLSGYSDKLWKAAYERGKAEALAERKKGRWIDHAEDGYVECPFCHSATNCDDNISDLHFCFLCGARMMQEGQEGEDNERA